MYPCSPAFETKHIFQCSDSINGIFTAIYCAYEMVLQRKVPSHICVSIEVSPSADLELFAVYHRIDADPDKALRVNRTLLNKLGEDAHFQIHTALLSSAPEKATLAYRMAAYGFHLHNPKQVTSHLSYDPVTEVWKLSRSVWNESHHLTGFIRFEELSCGILYGKISPKNQVLSLLAEYFDDRLPEENWMIHDTQRGEFLIHQSEAPSSLVSSPSSADSRFSMPEYYERSPKEAEIQALFREFVSSVSIRERENKNLQCQNLPLHFRKNMIEF